MISLSRELREDVAEARSALTLIVSVVLLMLSLAALDRSFLEEKCQTPVAILSNGQTP